MFLINSRLGLFTAATSLWLPFSRSYGVILPSSLTRVLPFVLEFSSRLPVSVCGTGTLQHLAAFLAGADSCASLLYSVPRHGSAFRHAYFTTCQPYRLDALFHPRAHTISPCHCVINLFGSTGFSTCCPSSTPFGLDLGPDLPWADEPSPGNLRLSTAEFLAPLSLLMPAFSLPYSPPPLPIWLLPVCIAPLPIYIVYSQASVLCLSPVNFRRNVTRPVSYYALF